MSLWPLKKNYCSDILIGNPNFLFIKFGRSIQTKGRKYFAKSFTVLEDYKCLSRYFLDLVMATTDKIHVVKYLLNLKNFTIYIKTWQNRETPMQSQQLNQCWCGEIWMNFQRKRL